MTTQSDVPLSSLLERAQYIKKAMATIEQEITNQTFAVEKNGFRVDIKGTCNIEGLSVDMSSAHLPVADALPKLQEAINEAIAAIDQKRQLAFKAISERLHDDDDS
jgi:DNA-binding protein YbaB